MQKPPMARRLKLPKKQKELQALLDTAYSNGHQVGHDYAKQKYDTAHTESVERERVEFISNMKMLESTTRLAEATSQAISTMCRAMYKGRGM